MRIGRAAAHRRAVSERGHYNPRKFRLGPSSDGSMSQDTSPQLSPFLAFTFARLVGAEAGRH